MCFSHRYQFLWARAIVEIAENSAGGFPLTLISGQELPTIDGQRQLFFSQKRLDLPSDRTGPVHDVSFSFILALSDLLTLRLLLFLLLPVSLCLSPRSDQTRCQTTHEEEKGALHVR